MIWGPLLLISHSAPPQSRQMQFMVQWCCRSLRLFLSVTASPWSATMLPGVDRSSRRQAQCQMPGLFGRQNQRPRQWLCRAQAHGTERALIISEKYFFFFLFFARKFTHLGWNKWHLYLEWELREQRWTQFFSITVVWRVCYVSF